MRRLRLVRYVWIIAFVTVAMSYGIITFGELQGFHDIGVVLAILLISLALSGILLREREEKLEN